MKVNLNTRKLSKTGPLNSEELWQKEAIPLALTIFAALVRVATCPWVSRQAADFSQWMSFEVKSPLGTRFDFLFSDRDPILYRWFVTQWEEAARMSCSIYPLPGGIICLFCEFLSADGKKMLILKFDILIKADTRSVSVAYQRFIKPPL
jgi:hypothetical protein